jgi:hypothetical protein
MSNHDPVTGEVLDDDEAGGEYARKLVAADGNPVPKRSNYIADVIRMIEEGQFNIDASVAMADLCRAMEVHAHSNKGSAKGKLTIELDFMLGNSIFVITPKFKVKKPEEKRAGTPLFLGENGSLGLNPPGQRALFGQRAPRDPFAAPEVREV